MDKVPPLSCQHHFKSGLVVDLVGIEGMANTRDYFSIHAAAIDYAIEVVEF
jgi:hypothetical protein